MKYEVTMLETVKHHPTTQFWVTKQYKGMKKNEAVEQFFKDMETTHPELFNANGSLKLGYAVTTNRI